MARLPQVEREIQELELLPDAELIRRARITNGKDPQHCSSEALLSCFRKAQREGARKLANALVEMVLRRLIVRTRVRLRTRKIAGLDEATENVAGKFAEMLASDAHGKGCEPLDFFEVLFENAVSALAFDEAKRVSGIEERFVPLVTASDSDDEGAGHDAYDGSGSADNELGLTDPELRVFSTQLLDAVARLSPDEQEVMILTILGVKAESGDESEPSIAGLCDVDPRTVRNRQKRAREKLANFKELT